MLKRRTFEAWLVLSALLVFSMGCVTLSPPPIAPPAVASSTDVLTVERVAPISPRQCHLKVTLNQPPNTLDAQVFLTAEPGIRFSGTRTQESEHVAMTLKAGEMRQHQFDCELDPSNIHLPGEYIVQAIVHDRFGQILHLADTRLPITLEEGGQPHFSPSQESFDAQFSDGFIQGGGNVQYRLDMKQDVYPTDGFLFLKVVSQQDTAAVTLQASVGGGVQFGDPSPDTATIALVDTGLQTIRISFGPIALNGSRIATVPFRLQPGTMAGTYLLTVVEENGLAPWMEDAPVLFRVERDPTLLAEPWLAGAQVAQAGPTQPAVRLGANVAAYQPTLPATATPVTPAAATATPAAPGATPDLSPTAVPTPTPTSGAAIQAAMYLVWDQPLTAYYGRCRDVYNQFIEGKLPMTWEAFQAAVVQHNPDLAATNCMFDPFKHYWLPAAASAEASH